MPLEIAGTAIEIRRAAREDVPALLRFASILPAHDLLFLARDIRQVKVLDAWMAGEAAGEIVSLVATAGTEIVATSAALSDRMSWSAHVWDIRLLVSPGFRNKGIGRRLLVEAVALACAQGARKLSAKMTPDQVGAITLFEECGFRAEALLRNQLADDGGVLHDLAVLALEPEDQTARHDAFV